MPEPKEKQEDEVEKDVGFGASHGYEKSHGGPSGPGDAPAKPITPAPSTPKKLPKKTSVSAGVSDAIRLDCRDSRRELGAAHAR